MELLVGIAVLVILSALVVTHTLRARHKARLTRLSNDLTSIAGALTQYAEDNNYQYPPDVDRAVPPGLERYLQGGVWPKSGWPHGVFDWDNWMHPVNGQQIYQISYRLCGLSDPIQYCRDEVLFPNFERNSSVFYCISGPCIPHNSAPNAPGYCVNCKPKEQNY